MAGGKIDIAMPPSVASFVAAYTQKHESRPEGRLSMRLITGCALVAGIGVEPMTLKL
jgi:hypothetical protein